jgi:hypothetical protein
MRTLSSALSARAPTARTSERRTPDHADPGPHNYIDVVGGSGRAYRFSRLRDGFPLSPVGGAYLLARHEGSRLEVVYIAAAESLLREAGQIWSQAAEQFRATLLFSRLNISGRSRDNEIADILAAQPLATSCDGLAAQSAAA